MQETFTAPDISCDHCKHAIEGALPPIEGVESAVVDIESKAVTVDYDPQTASREALLEAMEAEGYPASV